MTMPKVKKGHIPEILGRVVSKKTKTMWDGPRPPTAWKTQGIYQYLETKKIKSFSDSYSTISAISCGKVNTILAQS